MKNIEKYVKSSLKKKITVNRALIILFMITGSFNGISSGPNKVIGKDSYSRGGFVIGNGSLVGDKELTKEDIKKIKELEKAKKDLEAKEADLRKKMDKENDTNEKIKILEEIKKIIDERGKKEKELLDLHKMESKDSYTVGADTTTLGNYSFTIGDSSFTKGYKTYSLGFNNNVNGDSNQVHGNVNNISGDQNLVIGNNNKVKSSTEKKESNPGATIVPPKVITDPIVDPDMEENGIDSNVGGFEYGGELRSARVRTRRSVGANPSESTSIVNGNILQGNRTEVFGDGNIVFGSENKVGTETDVKINNILLGNKINATNVNNAIVFGNESKPIEGAVSFGNDTTTRQLKFVKVGVEDTDAVNVSQLKEYLKVKDASKFLKSEDVDVKSGDNYIKVDNNQNGKKNNYKISLKTDEIKKYITSSVNLNSKANVNADNITVNKWAEKLGTGEVKDGDANLVTGGKVYTELNKKLSDITVTGDTYITATKDTNDKSKYTLKFNKDELAKDLDLSKNTVLNNKANVNADNITVNEWAKKLGTGEIKDGDANLVTGGTVKAYITEEINTINNTVSGKLSSDDVDVKGDNYITVNKNTIKRNHYSLVFDKDKLATDLDLTNNAKLNEKFSKYALLDGSNLENINLNVWQAKLGNGTIASGNTGLVKGGDIFTYVNNIKQELNNQTTQDLSNKLDKDGTNLDKDSLDKLTNKLSEGSNLTTPTNRLVTDTTVSEALKGKLDVNANNLSENGVTNLTNKLGTGVVKEGDTGLITGGKVYEIKKELDNKYTTLNTQVTTNTNDISDINTKLGNMDNSITNINTKLDGKLDKADLSIKGDNYIKVENTNFNYKLSLNKDTLANDLDLTNNSSINNMFTTKLGNINTNIGDLKTKVESNTNNINSLTTKADTNTSSIIKLQQDMGNKLNADATNLSETGKTNLIDKLSKDSNIAKPKDRLVTDRQVNTYLSRYNDALGVVDKKSTVALEKSELALGGVANAVAMANLVQVNSYSDYRHNLSAAYGYYGGSHALAVGFSGTNEERNFVYKLSGSVNNKGNLAFGVGAGVMLGDKDERLTTEYSTKLKTVEKDLVEANKKIKEYEERQKATDIKVKELERKLNQILNKH